MQYTCHEQRDSGVLALLVVVCLLSSLQVVTLFAEICVEVGYIPRPSMLVSVETLSSTHATKCDKLEVCVKTRRRAEVT